MTRKTKQDIANCRSVTPSSLNIHIHVLFHEFGPGGQLILYAMQYLGDDVYVQEKTELHKCLDVYYAAYPDCDKSRVLASFCEVNGCVRVVIASVAFGLGINITNVRKIVIWGLPEMFLTLWQEIGRGGRDGEKAQAFLSYNKIQIVLRDVFTCKNCLRYGILKKLTFF